VVGPARRELGPDIDGAGGRAAGGAGRGCAGGWVGGGGDSDLVESTAEFAGFSHRRMAGETDAPRLISYYDGP